MQHNQRKQVIPLALAMALAGLLPLGVLLPQAESQPKSPQTELPGESQQSLPKSRVRPGPLQVSAGVTFTILVNFNYNNGADPYGSLILGPSSNTLYGMTLAGGTGGKGTLFKVSTTGKGFQTLVNFTGSSSVGSYPYGSLILGPDGNLYGMTSQGGFSGTGQAGLGMVFKVSRTGTGFLPLVNFNSIDNGALPLGSLVLGPNGNNLYGMTSQGGLNPRGTVFKVSRTGTNFQTLEFFNRITGYSPGGSLILGPNRQNLYGMTFRGGRNGLGTVFRASPTAQSSIVPLVNFNGSNGANPNGSLTLGPNRQNFYGMTSAGGANGIGTVFKVQPDGTGFQTLVSFNGSNNGSTPYGSLTLGPNGNLYGMTQYGGSNGGGTVFMVNRTTGQLTTLVNFSISSGASPKGDLLLASSASGTLTFYGMTYTGGAKGRGTLFRVTVPSS